MRPHRSPLKTQRRGAEPTRMHRGGTRLRRRLSTFALVVAIVTGMLATDAHAAGSGGGAAGSPSPTRRDLLAGDVGTGLPGLPIVAPPTSLRTARRFRWSDLSARDAWAKAAINYVGKAHDWMRDFAANPNGTYPFRPRLLETRKYFARALAKAFAPNAVVDPSIVFPDLDPGQSFYKWANIAVQKRWIARAPDGGFAPDQVVSMASVHRGLVLALRLKATAKRIDAISMGDGTPFDAPKHLGTTMLGMRLGLRYPSSEADHDVTPTTPMSRAQVAYSLYRATTLASWVVPWLKDQYSEVALPVMGRMRKAIVGWGLRYVGYPYVWGGEWGLDSPEPSALGGQPIAGFDCSGLAWWLLRADDGGAWNVSPPRPYDGWALPQRSSADMARKGRVTWRGLRVGDLAFYDGDGNGVVDHVNVYVGNGYALDASTSVGGVTLMYVRDGWYRDHFVHGRHILPAA
jgi:cell wall-associated NlpC family hydrolase